MNKLYILAVIIALVVMFAMNALPLARTTGWVDGF